MLLDEKVAAVLSSKGTASDDFLSGSPTLEGKLETALWKIGRMEDMDTQLRSQLEKIISERNQLSAENAARSIEIQHLQAQVELLEADSAGRHNADSRPGSPRDSGADKLTSHVDSLQADNTRLQHQVESAAYEISELQEQLHLSQQQQTTSPNASLEPNLHAQLSKSEYEVARQAAQILELQGEMTKAQVSFDRSAQRQTEANAQLTRQESTVSRHATTNTHLQDQLQEAQNTAASQHNRISQLENELADSKHNQLRTEKQCEHLEAEAQQQQELAAKQSSKAQTLQAQLDESTAAAASTAAAEQRLQGKLQVELEEQSRLKKRHEEERDRLQASASASASKQESLQAEVLSMKTEATKQLAQLQQKQHDMQSLQQKFESAVAARSALEHSLSEQTKRSQAELAEQHDTIERLQEQLADANSKLSQVQSSTAEREWQKVTQQEAASHNSKEVSELQAQLRKAQEKEASLEGARSLLQQQLGERTIVLGQKAHQIAHLTAQLNEAKGLFGSSPHEVAGKRGDTSRSGDTSSSLSLAKPSQSNPASPRQVQKADTSSASVVTPMQPVPAANKHLANSLDSLQSRPVNRVSAAETKHSPITPLQTDLAYPQRHTYTPSESDLNTGTKPSAGSESASKHAQQNGNGRYDGDTLPVLEGKFDQVNGKGADCVDDSNDTVPRVGGLPQQPAAVTANKSPGGNSDQTQLSPPQSCPSTPMSQMGNTLDSSGGYRSVTHVNSCFAKSDDGEEERGDSSSGSSLDQDQHAASADQHSSEADQRFSMSDKLQSHSKSLKAACKASSQATTDARETNKQAHDLEERLAECQYALDIVTDRALSAEVDVKAALTALSDADKLVSNLVYRKEAAEIVSVISGCIAAFVTTAATTVYWLH